MAAAGGNNVDTLQGGAGESFLGYPVRVSQVLPSTNTTYNNATIVLFGNLQLSSSFDARRGLTVDVDMSRYVEFRQVISAGSARSRSRCEWRNPDLRGGTPLAGASISETDGNPDSLCRSRRCWKGA
jgi:hypothetical protein